MSLMDLSPEDMARSCRRETSHKSVLSREQRGQRCVRDQCENKAR